MQKCWKSNDFFYCTVGEKQQFDQIGFKVATGLVEVTKKKKKKGSVIGSENL